ncbi:hypothetical protein Cylst_3314 [Cylindrospermum stagnale PCC 7417]|uniref:Uncharacterized protein n=1 Tax=Cylindrospermum stagnale PCC 7417 TaxID=56107 RepID=K9X088_9NOST|nr:hypothetical protein Cylst_3314 [Cylindrospermum stagnale PCC 7417]
MAPKIRFRTLRNYNDLECDNTLSSFKYLIKERNKKIYIQIDIHNVNFKLATTPYDRHLRHQRPYKS